MLTRAGFRHPAFLQHYPKKSVSRLRQKVGDLLTPENVAPWPEVRDQLNAVLRGWSNYFRCGSRDLQFRAVDNYVYDRVAHFLRRRHTVQSRGTPGSRSTGTWVCYVWWTWHCGSP